MLENALMDIYARSGQDDKVESLLQNATRPDTGIYGILIIAYCNSGRADRATEALHRMLHDSRVAPTVELFNTLIEALVESSRPDAVEQAFEFMRLMQKNERSLIIGVRPDVRTYNTLLECLAVPRNIDAGKRAVDVLDDMEGRYHAGDILVKPSQISYNLAVKACCQAQDLERADTVLKRMKKPDITLTIQAYNDILHYYSLIGTSAAAERTEQILAYMKDLAKSTPFFKPNETSYNIVLAAWTRSGDPDAANRMWTIYEQMLTDQIDLDIVGYNTLKKFLKKTRKPEDAQRACRLRAAFYGK
jgi:pentatricopeptide repeat protein